MEMSFNFAWIAIIVIGLVLLFLLKELIYKNLRNISLKTIINKDIEIVKILTAKFPDVSENFINKTVKEQNVENNQEIHEINKKLNRLETDFYDMRENILSKLDALTKRIEK